MIVSSEYFNNYILGCIIVAGALVGVGTYNQYANGNTAIKVIDMIILISFTSEVGLKVIAEGMFPQYYLLGEEWKWNLFDLLIVLFSYPVGLPVSGGSVRLLRLVRLMRLAKVFRKVPQLQMIVMGLVGGLKSVFYVTVLLVLVFYIYAIVGVLFFQQNDPVHFQSIEITMLVLLQTATLDGWGDIFYVNFYGCFEYPSYFYTSDLSASSSDTGAVHYCPLDIAQPQPVLTFVYFVSFIVIASFCMMSLFIGTVALSMSESMAAMKTEKIKLWKEQEKEKMIKITQEYSNYETLNRKTKRSLKLLELALNGRDLNEVFTFDYSTLDQTKHPYLHILVESYATLCLYCQIIADNTYFQQFVFFAIILAGILAGMETDWSLQLNYKSMLEGLGNFVQTIFLIEFVLKFFSEDFQLYKYFYDSWNCFDFLVVFGSYMPTGQKSLLTMLRLLRLLRVLKLVRQLPQLQVIVVAISKGIESIGFISLLLFIFFYFMAIICMLFFQSNDPGHFATLHMSIISLFDAATLDGWSSFMFTAMYGCNAFPSIGECPHNSTGNFALGAIFWVFFVLIGSLVLLTLFIGVVSMGMEEAKQEQEEDQDIERKAIHVCRENGVDPFTKNLYFKAFNIIDFTQSGRIETQEMKLGLSLAKVNLTDEEFEEMWAEVDEDGSGVADFSEFLQFLISMRKKLQARDGIEVSQATSKKGGLLKRFSVSLSPGTLFLSQKSTALLGGSDHGPGSRAQTPIDSDSKQQQQQQHLSVAAGVRSQSPSSISSSSSSSSPNNNDNNNKLNQVKLREDIINGEEGGRFLQPSPKKPSFDIHDKTSSFPSPSSQPQHDLHLSEFSTPSSTRRSQTQEQTDNNNNNYYQNNNNKNNNQMNSSDHYELTADVDADMDSFSFSLSQRPERNSPSAFSSSSLSSSPSHPSSRFNPPSSSSLSTNTSVESLLEMTLQMSLWQRQRGMSDQEMIELLRFASKMGSFSPGLLGVVGGGGQGGGERDRRGMVNNSQQKTQIQQQSLPSSSILSSHSSPPSNQHQQHPSSSIFSSINSNQSTPQKLQYYYDQMQTQKQSLDQQQPPSSDVFSSPSGRHHLPPLSSSSHSVPFIGHSSPPTSILSYSSSYNNNQNNNFHPNSSSSSSSSIPLWETQANPNPNPNLNSNMNSNPSTFPTYFPFPMVSPFLPYSPGTNPYPNSSSSTSSSSPPQASNYFMPYPVSFPPFFPYQSAPVQQLPSLPPSQQYSSDLTPSTTRQYTIPVSSSSSSQTSRSSSSSSSSSNQQIPQINKRKPCKSQLMSI